MIQINNYAISAHSGKLLYSLYILKLNVDCKYYKYVLYQVFSVPLSREDSYNSTIRKELETYISFIHLNQHTNEYG